MQSKVPLKNHSDLSLAYTPGVAVALLQNRRNFRISKET
jgi:malic enzyme